MVCYEASKQRGHKVKSPIERKSNRYPVPALDKGLDLLEVLAGQTRGMALVELAAASEKKVTEIFRMVDCLKRRGYIAVDPQTDRLILSMKLYELAHRYPPTERLLAVALPQMRALALDTGQSCHLAVHSHGEMLVIAQIDSARNMGFAVHIGGKVGLTSSASGRAYLAFQDDHEQARLLASAQDSLAKAPTVGRATTGTDATHDKTFLASIQRIRRKGYVSMPSDFIRGITNMSFPVLSFSGPAVAALTIPHLQWQGDDGFPDLAGTRVMLGDAASRISSGIGNIPSPAR